MKRQKRFTLGKSGFTLVEVMVAFAIFLLTSSIFISGVMFAMRIKEKTLEIEHITGGIGSHLMDKEACESGTVRLAVGDEDFEISADGWIYHGDGMMDIIWMDYEFGTDMMEIDDEENVEEKQDGEK